MAERSVSVRYFAAAAEAAGWMCCRRSLSAEVRRKP